MASKSTVSRSNKSSVRRKKPVRSEPEVPEKAAEMVMYTPLRLMVDVIYKIRGDVTGNEYVWNRSNSVVMVDNRDVPTLLAKKRKGSCCGSDGGKIFEEVEEGN